VNILAAIVGAAVVLWLLSRRSATAPASDFNTNESENPMGVTNQPTTSKAWTKLQEWADAIMRFEGVNPNDGKLTLAERKNNPGNLRDPKTGQYREFATFDEGRRALEADLAAKVRKYPNWTLLQIMERYAPASDNNDPLAYAKYIAKRLDVAVTDTLKNIFG
jgi:hypothetical protein